MRSLIRAVRALAVDLRELVYPVRCLLCGAPAPQCGALAMVTRGGVCDEHALPDPEQGPRGPRCGVCARRLADFLPDGDRCAECRLRRPRFTRLVVLGDYREEEGLRRWILALKHGGRRDLAGPLGRALAHRLLAVVARPDVLLVPVPLHPVRRLERGFDQARLLAESAGRELGAPVRRLLVRRRWTETQGALGSRSRSANVAGAFAPRPAARADLLGVSVWLVDDVVTSGATAEACAHALGELGARRVHVLALARAASRDATD